MAYTSKPPKKTKKTPVNAPYSIRRNGVTLTAGETVDDPGSMRVERPRGKSTGTYAATNTTTNARAGQSYRTEASSKGLVHVYENGKRVLVKKKPAKARKYF